MKNIFRKLHLWLSVPLGLVMTVTCFTGALLVYENEITALCNGMGADVTPSGGALPLDVIVEKVSATLLDDVGVKGVVVPNSPDEAYRVNLSKPRNSAVVVNQYTGEIIGREERLPFFQAVFRLHRWLMDSNPGDGAVFWGKMIVGVSTLFFVVVLLTGFVIWWPRNRKMLKNRLCIAVKKGNRRFWYDLHVAGGFYAFLLLLTMALTGLVWSFEWYKDGLYTLLDANGTDGAAAVTGLDGGHSHESATAVCPGKCSVCSLPVCVHSVNDTVAVMSEVCDDTVLWSADAVTAATGVVDARYIDEQAPVSIADVDGCTAATTVDAQSGATQMVDGDTGATLQSAPQSNTVQGIWQLAFDNVLARHPQFETITVSAGTVSVKKSIWGNMRAADKYLFDESNGDIIKVETYADADRESKVSGWLYSLHIGSWGGWLTRLFSFLAAILGATLPLTGYYFWIKRLYGKRRHRK